jgi:hypothetical protein
MRKIKSIGMALVVAIATLAVSPVMAQSVTVLPLTAEK